MMRIIAHLDMDAFFAAIEERDNPQFRGLPIVVGADPQGGKGRGVVSTANYKAREYGIHSAMPISQAWRLSEQARKQGKPVAVFLPPNFGRYSEISRRIMAILRKYSPLIEEASIDEAYFDLSSAKTFSRAKAVCLKIKNEIKEQKGLTCSIGIGPNKLVAKIASGIKKPDGLTGVNGNEAEEFLAPLPIRAIPGIGPKTEALFKSKGIAYVRDLKKISQAGLKEMMGKWGIELYDKIRARDSSPLVEEYEAKSVGEQETFDNDTRNPQFIFGRLNILCTGVFRRFKKEGFRSFRTVTITVRFHDFETKSRSHTLQKPATSPHILKFEATRMLSPFLDKRENPRRKLLRLIGVRVEKLSL